METLLKLDQQICFPLYALSRKITALYRPILDELDITYPQYLVLLVLWEERGQTVNQLGEKLRLDTGTLTPLLKRMEQKGMVTRVRNARDERVVTVSLTDNWKLMEQKAKCIPEKLMASIGVPEDELLQLKAIINKILIK